MTTHHVILVPGLADNAEVMDYLTKSWPKEISVHIHPAPWHDLSAFTDKLQSLLKLIDHYAKHGGKVSLIGVSAGGSMAINAFACKKAKINKVVNVCGRIHVKNDTFPSHDVAAKGIPSFEESVKHCEKNIKRFTQKDKTKIMTFSGIWDGVVPLSAIPLRGATNIKIPFIFHIICIGAVFLFYKKQMIEFIKS